MTDVAGSGPRLVAFVCNWCTYAAADLAGSTKLEISPAFSVVRVMCSSLVDHNLVLSTFFDGADGILIAGCHPGDCHYTSGNLKARARWALMEVALEQAGVDPRRVRLQWASAAEAQIFADGVKIITEQVRELGPIGREWK